MCGAKGCAPDASGSDERMVMRRAEGAVNMRPTRRGAPAKEGARDRSGSTANSCSPASRANCLAGCRKFQFSSGPV